VHPDLKADFVLANPPFNVSDWARDESDPRWSYGVPPQSNANYAWLQHVISKLDERGTAGVVLSNSSLSSKSRGEGEVRRAIIDADLVACIVWLPPHLFRTTSIPACLWVLTKNKPPQHRSRILFIDARELGTMIEPTGRILDDAAMAKIVGTYHAWRGTASARKTRLAYQDEPGFCFSADLQEVREHEYVLTPGRYVSARRGEDQDLETNPEKRATLTKDLYGLFD
jgi:type I restriction enzyme M protein